MLDGGTNALPPAWHPTNNDLTDVQNGPMARAGADLIAIYQEFLAYENQNPGTPFVSAKTLIRFDGTSVGVDIRVYGDATSDIKSLQNLGMKVENVLPQTNETLVSGLLPIGQLPTVAEMPQIIGLMPIYKPIYAQQGIANNQADASLKADVARSQFNVDGTGTTVGVISGSVSQFGNGLADSIKTGDIAAGSVNVLKDGPAGSDDEGRAMIENIHDIAPGAKFAFSTDGGSEASFASAITSLAAAGSQIIVDDVRYLAEPVFQDGIVAQAVESVAKNDNVTYFSAADNYGNQGYESPFRGVTTNVTGVGQGRFFNFNPGAGPAATNLSFTEFQGNAALMLQWDNPFYTTNGVTSDVNFFVLDANNAVVYSGNTNAIATQAPVQIAGITAPGTYSIVVQVVSGPDPGRIHLTEFSNAATVSHPFGTAGGVTYSTTGGHNAAADAIGTGAVPWWGTTPFTNPPTVASEPFSSFGPINILFNPDGSRAAAPQTRLEPLVSAPDGGQTSFFGGVVLDTSNPPFPGEPATPTNLNVNPKGLQSFFGTSSASPNLAAVAALMRQLSPSSTPTDIRNALIAAAQPLNGAVKGAWDPQGGFGIVNAVQALGAIDQLRVTTITPGGGATVNTPPGSITVTFSKPIDFASIKPGALMVTGPPGVTVTVGQPIAVDDPNFPTIVRFPFTFTRAPGVTANGTFTESFAAGSIVAKDGKPLAAFSSTFTIADTMNPRITGTSRNGRIIKISFNAPLDPSTVNAQNFLLVRANNPAFAFNNNPANIIVSNDPRVVFSYDSTTDTVTIDLSALDQASLPTDRYAIVVNAPPTDANGRPTGPGVTDIVGNPLDGEFNGAFPSGEGDPPTPGNPSGRSGFETFVQDLGIRSLTGPIFNSVSLAPASDSGIVGDQNTNVQQPTFIGQLGSNFLGTVANVLVLAEFNGLHGGAIDLAQGANGRGFMGNYDVLAVTDSAGRFSITAPTNLPDGFNRVRFIAIGPADSPPLPGFSTISDQSFRVDTTLPTMDDNVVHPDGASLPQNAKINTLTNLSLYFVDPIQPTALNSPFVVPTQLSVLALDPSTANNISNYSLYQSTVDAKGNPIVIDRSAFIKTATFVSTTRRVLTSDPYTGRVDLTFGTGLPQGNYTFVAHTAEPGFSGIRDSAGNPLAGNPSKPTTPQDYYLSFTFQPQPAYITSVKAVSPDGTLSDPRSYFEVPAPGVTPRAAAPPNQFVIDFSNPLLAGVDYSNDVQIIASADTPGGTPDGNFGDFGIANTGQGYSRVNPTGTTVTLTNSVAGATFGQPGYLNRLVLTLPANFTLLPDYYRLYVPNSVAGGTAIIDQFSNQLDGEFLGDKTANGTYEDLLPTGQYRQGLSGDGVAGGAFVTGYLVVPNGNVIYARPDYQQDPYLPQTAPDGSLAKPYPVLAPQAAPNGLNGGDLNSTANFGTGFNPIYDRAGLGRFAESALFAAQVASARGPVVVVALPGTIIRDPITGQITQQTFVLQAPAGTDPLINDASVAVPAMTTLVFAAGSTLKMENAALFVQNQGSALQMNGGPNPTDQVNVTSYADNSIGGATNLEDPNSTPRGGDYGGIVFRNFDQTNRSSLFQGQIQTTGNNTVDGRLKGPGGADAISGADDVMSVIDNTRIQYAGGAVPATIGTRYDAITLLNSRPAITNDTITQTGGAAGAQAAISGNLDSFREDEVARGPLIRRATLLANSLNGIYVRAELNGVAEPTDAINYPLNPSNLGGARNFTFDSPYPYLLTSRLVMGSTYLQETGGSEGSEPDRLYIQPGMMVKLEPGAAIEVQGVTLGNQHASLNVGDRTYMNEFDANPNLAPVLSNGQPNPAFKANSTTDARVLFTSIFDNTASTFYFDPVTQVTTTIVAPLDSTNSGGLYQPLPGNVPIQARWGSITISSPGVAVINDSEIRYGGGSVNTAGGTVTRHALEFAGASGFGQNGTGTHVSITDNNFYDNADVPMNITPDGLFAGDPLRPLQSGKPFFRNNVMLRNGINGLGVSGSGPLDRQRATDHVNSVWDSNDLVYILRSTVALAGRFLPQAPDPTQPAAQPTPAVTLTIQSTLPGTVLADGSVVARPGESPIVKLLGAGPNVAFTTTPNITSENWAGAGFITGMDNGVDTNDPLIDIGVDSQIRFLGIGGNETTGQQRVPVIITSLHDSTVGRTVRGVSMFQAVDGDTTAPQPGDGGNIIFGAHTLTSYNLYDPRQGDLIDNADIRYISRIEQIGGGILATYDINGDNGFAPADDNGYAQKLGLPLPLPNAFGDQYNQPNAMTVSNSNLANFRDYGFFAHPGFNSILIAENYAATPPVYRGPMASEATQTFFINDTFANMPTAIQINSDTVADSSFESPPQAVFLNNTFYANGNAITTTAPAFNGTNGLDHVNFLAMNNIFSNTTGTAVVVQGQADQSQLQYNLFFANGQDTDFSTSQFMAPGPNNFPVFGNPQFRDPTNGNFFLQPNSAAIDASRSEIGPIVVGDILLPAATQVLGPEGGVRNFIGRSNAFGGDGFIPSSQDFVTLPGYPIRTFADQFVAALPGTPNSYSGPASNPATFNYMPIAGERDAAGYLRVDDPNVPNVGFGSRPFFDIGAFEYRALFPPHVTGVTATYTDPTNPAGVTTKSIYQVGGIAGTNLPPQSIQVQFDSRLDPNTINDKTILLQASGGDGIFGNGNNAADRSIDLAGKLAFNPVTHVLTISLADAGLVLNNDEYRIIILGNGSNVVRDLNGNALDGENLDANGVQRALPSGDSFPGGNFVVTFSVDTHPPAVVNSTFVLDASTDSNRRDGITNVTMPSFSGKITDIFPPLNFLQGQTVHIDISTNGDGVFNLIDAGIGTTDANGNFNVPITQALPDSPYNVGPDGILAYDYTKNPPVRSVDDYGYSLARVRVVDQSGNVSNVTTAPLSSYIAQGAVTSFVVDTKGPRVTSLSPAPGTLATLSNGEIPVTIGFDKNVDPATLNTNTIKVVRSGGDGVFGNGNDVPLTIDPTSFKFTYLHTPYGAESVTFNVMATPGTTLANDVYNVSISGTAPNAVTDIAGNALDGEFNGTFPSGNGTPGGDFNPTFIVFSPALSHVIFVSNNPADVSNAAATPGTRANPLNSITGGLFAARTGDIVAVLPGVYTESIVLKSLVSLVSASETSTDGNVVPGDPLQTVIRAAAPTGANTTITVDGSNLTSVPGGSTLNTEISGFTIASPLSGNPAFGPIQLGSIGLRLNNADIVVTRDYFIDSDVGVYTIATGAGAVVPRINNDVIVGNHTGIVIDGSGASSLTGLGQVINDTIGLNDQGMVVVATAASPVLATIANDIFWQNHNLTPNRLGNAIFATTPGKLQVLNNLFSGNGPSQNSPADDTTGVGGAFDPSVLVANAPDANGNFTGDPAFVSPRDPRPGADGPGVFFTDVNFDLTFPSAAIDRANPLYAPSQDFRYRPRVALGGRAFPGTGPADVGAFEFSGSGGGGGLPVGGELFHVATTSLLPGGVAFALGQSVPAANAPAVLDVAFSANVDRSSVTPTDLVLSGDGIDANNPVHATSLTWIDNHTVQFNLTGGYNKSGYVFIDIPANSIRDTRGRGIAGHVDAIKLVAPQTPAPAAAVAQAAVVQIPITQPKVTHRNPAIQPPIHRRRGR